MSTLLFTPPLLADEQLGTIQNDPFSMEKPLKGLSGNADRGKKLVIARDKGNCLACHALPIPEEPFHGTVGPSLMDIGTRMNEGQIRFRVMNQQRINPHTVMPGYYKDSTSLNRVLAEYHGKSMLTAQEIEDIVAYLVRLQ